MDIVNSFFSNLIFTLVEYKEGFGIYAARISEPAGFGRMKYVLVFVEQSLCFEQKTQIQNLQWVNIQTRMLESYFSLKPQKLTFSRNTPDVQLRVVSKSKASSKYEGENFIYEVMLLNDPKKKDCTGESCSIYQYYSNMTLSACIETFNCVISLKPRFNTEITPNDIEYI